MEIAEVKDSLECVGDTGGVKLRISVEDFGAAEDRPVFGENGVAELRNDLPQLARAKNLTGG